MCEPEAEKLKEVLRKWFLGNTPKLLTDARVVFSQIKNSVDCGNSVTETCHRIDRLETLFRMIYEGTHRPPVVINDSINEGRKIARMLVGTSESNRSTLLNGQSLFVHFYRGTSYRYVITYRPDCASCTCQSECRLLFQEILLVSFFPPERILLCFLNFKYYTF
mgnify:CR=1 FL=1